MISVSNLHFTYPKAGTPAVKGISFEIQKGEIFGFLGPSGAGKSTAQKVLIKLLPGFTGNARVLGKPLSEWDNRYYEHIGVGFELPNHYPKLTALENLRFFGTFYDKKIHNPMTLLASVGLEDSAHKKVEDFSKGMKMRLNFIRSYLHDPDILFLDEPTSGLDPVNARIMKDIILNLKAQGKTIFITTHNMYDADELCDRVAFIVDGEITLIGEPRELKLKAGKRKVTVRWENGSLQKESYELDGLGKNEEFLALLNKEKIESIHSEEATLEDVFIKTTGRQLR